VSDAEGPQFAALTLRLSSPLEYLDDDRLTDAGVRLWRRRQFAPGTRIVAVITDRAGPRHPH
jgi:hypothetical protein